MAKTYQNAVGIFADAAGFLTFKKVESGGYTAPEVADLVADMIKAKKPVKSWALWVETGEPWTPTRNGSEKTKAAPRPDIKAAAFKALVEGAESVELVAVWRSSFMAPVLYIVPKGVTPGGKTGGTEAKAKPTARIGR